MENNRQVTVVGCSACNDITLYKASDWSIQIGSIASAHAFALQWNELTETTHIWYTDSGLHLNLAVVYVPDIAEYEPQLVDQVLTSPVGEFVPQSLQMFDSRVMF